MDPARGVPALVAPGSVCRGGAGSSQPCSAQPSQPQRTPCWRGGSWGWVSSLPTTFLPQPARPQVQGRACKVCHDPSRPRQRLPFIISARAACRDASPGCCSHSSSKAWGRLAVLPPLPLPQLSPPLQRGGIGGSPCWKSGCLHGPNLPHKPRGLQGQRLLPAGLCLQHPELPRLQGWGQGEPPAPGTSLTPSPIPKGADASWVPQATPCLQQDEEESGSTPEPSPRLSSGQRGGERLSRAPLLLLGEEDRQDRGAGCSCCQVSDTGTAPAPQPTLLFTSSPRALSHRTGRDTRVRTASRQGDGASGEKQTVLAPTAPLFSPAWCLCSGSETSGGRRGGW